jgi:Ca2+-binding EF-hand superfamily protein
MKRTTVWVATGLLAVAGLGAGLAIAERGSDGRFGWRGHGSDMRGQDMRGSWGRALTKDEFNARTRERFARLDKNSDNVIDASEIEAMLSERGGRHFGRAEQAGRTRIGRFDADRDGKITRDEFLNNVKQRFAQLDLNNDGKITDEDLPPSMRGLGVLSRAEDGGGGRHGRLLALVRGADANKDGVVTLDEALAAAQARFARLDKNGDGVIDNADREQMRKEMVDYQVKRFIHRYGADADGKVSREKFTEEANARFARLDVNKDGQITRDERPWRDFGWRHHGRDGDGERRGWHRGPRGEDGRPHRGGLEGGSEPQ